MLHIIHSSQRHDRYTNLTQELEQQHIKQYKIWPAILTPLEPHVGIAQAHKQVIRFAQKNKISSITIAEDDICFTSTNAYNYYLSCKPENFDLYLGSITSGLVTDNNLTSDFSGLTLYTIHQKFYDCFLQTPETSNIDRLLKQKGIFIVCNPFVAIQQNGYSDNRQEYCNYDTCYTGRSLYSD